MPYRISKGGGSCGKSQWAVLNKSTGKTMGCHSTQASAKKQLAALAVNVTSKESAEPATADADQGEAQTGVVIVALPAANDPVQGIGPEQKHATVLYFGDVPGGENPNDLLTDDARALMVQVLTIAAATYGPLTEQVTGIERLGDAGALVWMLQGTELPDLRNDLLDTDSELVGPLENVVQYPSYTPHVTIGYLQADPEDDTTEAAWAKAAVGVDSVTFDRLALWWAGEQLEYPLTGSADPGRGSATEAKPRPGGHPMPKQLHESTRLVALEAAAGAPTNRRPIQIITPGWGSSGYYSAEVLERAAKDKVIPKGTHMYLNHASESERTDRPEREVEKIAAVLVEDARWDGTRLLANADLMGPHAELIEAVAPYIGVSISGSATDVTIGEAEGRTGPIIEGLAHVASVDFVTHAGRGGMVLLESARPSLVNALAVEHGVSESTANETRELLSQALREMFPGEKVWVWVRDFDDTQVWYEHETPDECGTYSLAYSLSDDGVVTFSGSPVEVRPETNYVPVPPGGTTKTEEAEAMAEDPKEGAASAAPAAAAPGTVPAAESTDTDTKETNMSDTTGAGGTAAPTPTAQEAAPVAPRNPREVMEAQMREQGRQIALLRAGQKATGIVAEILSSGWIGEAQKTRLVNELTAEATLPITESGDLDEAKLRAAALARLDEAESEAAEILSSAGVGKVQGLGAATRAATETALHHYDQGLTESFKELGLSESAVETAVKGR